MEVGSAAPTGLGRAIKIYHITHLDNLPSILGQGGLVSDAERLRNGLACHEVGMSKIKRRRLEELEVTCYPGMKVGAFVPFYFAPRSVMLYLLHRGNHPEVTYRGGQRPIVHLQADVAAVIRLAQGIGLPWAFSDRNAGGHLARFSRNPSDLERLDWSAIQAADFREARVSEAKQAEFLVSTMFPWYLVEQIGVIDMQMADRVRTAIAGNSHQPPVTVQRAWYY